ncbi:MAG TPA: hypothetical protein VK786_00795, partial [bacterium]|nr:hypothetical protein [bacterium]
LLVAASLPAQTPMRYFYGLVAGSMDPAYRDGAFNHAAFKAPSGILYDPIQDRLIVADTGNGKIREILLARNNAVDTVSFQGTTAPAQTMPLARPLCLEWLSPGHSFFVYDAQADNIAVADLDASSLTWLAPGDGSSPLGRFLKAQKLSSFSYSPEWKLLFCVSSQSKNLLILGVPGLAALSIPDTDPSMFAYADVRCLGDRLFALRDNGQGRQLMELTVQAAQPLSAHFFDPNPGPQALSPSAAPMLVSKPVPAAANASPYSIVKGSDELHLACDAPAIGCKIGSNGYPASLWLYDREGRTIGVDNNITYDSQGNSVASDSEQKGKRLFEKPAYSCEDPRTQTWFLTDQENNRIVSFRDLNLGNNVWNSANDQGLCDFNYPAYHPPYMNRICMFGESVPFYSTDQGARSRWVAFPKMLEYLLDLKGSLDDFGQSFEIIYCGQNGGGGSLSALGTMRARLRQVLDHYHPDEVYVCLNSSELLGTATDYTLREPDAKGLPDVNFDPEFLMNGGDPSKPSPLYKQFRDYVVANAKRFPGVIPASGIQPLNWAWGSQPVIQSDYLSDPRFKELLFAFSSAYLDDLT